MTKRKVIIMGAAGRDFHNFNMLYRDNEDYEVVAFTATQMRISLEENTQQSLLASCIQMESQFLTSRNL